MRAAILSIGDELTLGQSLDTNSEWLAARLAEHSILTVEHRTVADDRQAIAAAISQLCSSCELLLITGGLGPTEDDLTREAVGDVVTAGQPLATDAQALAHIESLFAKRKRAMPAMNRRQALRPAIMRCLPNPHGTAPGLAGEFRRSQVFCLPGPPREMRPMFTDHVLPAIKRPPSAALDVILTGRVQEFGMGESDAAQKLGEMMDRDRNPLVGTTVRDGIVTARVRASGDPSRAAGELERTLAAIEAAWTPYAFGRDDATLAGSLTTLMRRGGASRTLVTAESCTGGWLGKVLVDVPGASSVYLGGWIVYANQMKVDALEVPPEVLARFGAVSSQAAQAMAIGALKASGADYSLSITGIAGPEGGTAAKPVGTVFIGLGSRQREQMSATVRQFLFTADRMTMRERSINSALQMLRFDLLGELHDAPLLWEIARPAAHQREPSPILVDHGGTG